MVDIKQVHLNTFDSDLEIRKRFLNEKIIKEVCPHFWITIQRFMVYILKLCCFLHQILLGFSSIG